MLTHALASIFESCAAGRGHNVIVEAFRVLESSSHGALAAHSLRVVQERGQYAGYPLSIGILSAVITVSTQ